ncbi:hypothetical protein WHR41_08556 [Cladosporium halotolerans]|uniref:Uncharacterized protein n=1 Tax=Cladosporium halotolerans TaxID=1052096 RepID=A0AB34KBW3_9PEZI
MWSILIAPNTWRYVTAFWQGDPCAAELLRSDDALRTYIQRSTSHAATAGPKFCFHRPRSTVGILHVGLDLSCVLDDPTKEHGT